MVIVYIGIEYVHEYIVGEHVDCHEPYVRRVSMCSGIRRLYKWHTSTSCQTRLFPEMYRMTVHHETFR